MIVSETTGNYKIETDLITVWVHNERGFMVGRFGPGGMEVGGNGIGWWVQPTNENSPSCWIRWATQLGIYHKLVMPMKFRPVWAEPQLPPSNDN